MTDDMSLLLEPGDRPSTGAGSGSEGGRKRRRPLRTLVIVLVVVVLAVLLTGCGGAGAAAPGDSESPAAAAPSAETLEPGLVAQLDAALDESFAASGLPGVIVGLWVPGQGERVAARGTAALGTDEWSAGQVTVCCTTDDDVHQVRCGGEQPVVGIHVYGADIGTLPRRSYDPATGAVHWFTSSWGQPTRGQS